MLPEIYLMHKKGMTGIFSSGRYEFEDILQQL